jgi:hypothetical protein
VRRVELIVGASSAATSWLCRAERGAPGIEHQLRIPHPPILITRASGIINRFAASATAGALEIAPLASVRLARRDVENRVRRG